MAREVTVAKLDAGLDRLQEKIGEAEAQIRALRAENARLRAAIESAPPPEPAAARSGRPMRQIVLESERQEIRTRIRNLIEAL
jgi:multidrug resistance efflux pump